MARRPRHPVGGGVDYVLNRGNCRIRKVECPRPGSFDSLVTTAEHPFYVLGRNTFVPVSDLRLGDDFLLASGLSGELVRVEIEHGSATDPFTTYNFEVEDFHTYFVGEDGVWVHNSGRALCERECGLYRKITVSTAWKTSLGMRSKCSWRRRLGWSKGLMRPCPTEWKR